MRQVRLKIVQTAAERAIYHQLLRNHHYLGAGSMVGTQLRYLARSGGEVVGAVGFGVRIPLIGEQFVCFRNNSFNWEVAALAPI